VLRLERELAVVESWESIQSRAMLTRWLAGCDDAATLYDDYVYLRDTLGAVGVLASPAGRAAIVGVLESLYAFEAGPEPEQNTSLPYVIRRK
jgi:hypothetical protein